MKVSRTEFNHFAKLHSLGHFPGQRYGQAWYNHFKLHAHNAFGDDRTRLDYIYNERNENIARVTILNYYVDETQ